MFEYLVIISTILEIIGFLPEIISLLTNLYDLEKTQYNYFKKITIFNVTKYTWLIWTISSICFITYLIVNNNIFTAMADLIDLFLCILCMTLNLLNDYKKNKILINNDNVINYESLSDKV